MKGSTEPEFLDEVPVMRMSNDTYHVMFRGKNVTEHYYRDSAGWVKVSNRGRVSRMSAEQVLNHLLPALAFGDRLHLTVTVEHHEDAYWKTLPDREG